MQGFRTDTLALFQSPPVTNLPFHLRSKKHKPAHVWPTKNTPQTMNFTWTPYLYFRAQNGGGGCLWSVSTLQVFKIFLALAGCSVVSAWALGPKGRGVQVSVKGTYPGGPIWGVWVGENVSLSPPPTSSLPVTL